MHATSTGYARDTTQCVDYFVGLQDFGVWACFDAGNDEFVYDIGNDRYCLQLDHDKCVRGVGEKAESVLLRVPGEAACLQLDDAHRPLTTHTCDEKKPAQRWRFDPPLGAFRAVSQSALCLDYSLEDQAFAVWSCDLQEKENAADENDIALRGFVYHRYSGKYCLKRGHGATCVQEATSGSSLLLRRASTSAGCLQHGGNERRADTFECDAGNHKQLWVFHSSTATFRAASDASICLDLFTPNPSDHARATEDERELMTMDDGGALGSWTCQPHVPNQRFAFDRYMGRYCVTSRPNICVMEAILGTPLRLRLPGAAGKCLEFDGSLQSLQEKGCNASEPQQQWSYDAATLVFRHAANSRVCIDYFVQHNTFGAWTCRDELEVNAQQSFRYDEGRDRFCLLSDPRRCVQEATSDLLY